MPIQGLATQVHRAATTTALHATNKTVKVMADVQGIEDATIGSDRGSL